MTLKERSAEGMCPHSNLFRTSARWSWRSAILLVAIAAVSSAFAQGRSEEARRERPAPTQISLDPDKREYQITENGPHHRKWERVEKRVNEEGEEEEIVHRYTELGTGLNRWDEDRARWVESDESIEKFRGGAVAKGGQQKVIFAPNIKTEGAVDISNPDGVRIRSSVLGLAYFDTLSGADVIIAEVKASRGEILPPNQIIYRDAFDGVRADVLYTYRRSGVVQDVILREQPPLPQNWGIPALTARLEVMSEVFDEVLPVKQQRVLYRKVKDSQLRAAMVEPDIQDQELSFGEMRMVDGTAFPLGKEGSEREEGVPVGKKWEIIEGRGILFESLEYDAVEAHLKDLPQRARSRAAASPVSSEGRVVALQQGRPLVRQLPLPFAPIGEYEEKPNEEVLIALADTEDQLGFVIDYTTISSSIGDYTFKAGETYHIANTLYAYGKTTFEGGAVIKNSSSTLNLHGDVDFPKESFSPVIFTSVHDDTVGEIIAGSSGTPLSSSYYAWHVRISAAGLNDLVIQNARISYARFGINSWASNRLTVRNVQIADTTYGLGGYWSTDGKIENALFRDCYVAISNSYGTQFAANVTFDGLTYLYFGPSLELKNSLIVNVGNIVPYTRQGQSDNVELPSGAGVFQTVGSGAHYLANGSPYRDAGISQIAPSLVSELENGTTFQPTVLPEHQVLTANTTWNQQAARDDDGIFDLGYHYPAIDYLLNDTEVSNGAVLTVNPGTHIGWYGSRGVTLQEDATVLLKGTAADPIRVGWYGDLQEGTDPARVDVNSHIFFAGQQTSPVQNQNALSLDATYVSPGSYRTNQRFLIELANPSTQGIGTLAIRDSRVRGMEVEIDDSSGHQHSVFNTEFHRGVLALRGEHALEFRHNHVSAALVDLDQIAAADPWTLQDNVFASPAAGSTSSFTNAQLDFNGYVNTSFRLSNSTLSNDVVHSYMNFETGPFGPWYQPASSQFIDAGSRLADAAGLLHHTVLEGGSPEGDDTSVSVVDIGLHYPAVDGNGDLLDADGDSAPNILEDLNGNGMVDPGETPWAPGPPTPPPPPPVVYTFQVFTPLD